MLIVKGNYKIFILFGLITLNLFFLFFVDQTETNELRIYFFDVGQGDSIFIETPNGNQVLIDGGPDNSVVHKLSKVMPFWDRTIDLVILTHPDADHLTGLIEVLKRYKVKAVMESGIECGKPDCLVWEGVKKKERAVNFSAKLGQKIVFDENIEILVLHPFEYLAGQKVSKANNSSIVAKLVYGGYSFLLAGDIEEQIERKLVLAGIDIDSDYLKVAHHGSKTSSADSFLDVVSPLLAFISSGNRYGHPHKEVTERLENKGIKYYRTDTYGDILLRCKLNSPCRLTNQN